MSGSDPNTIVTPITQRILAQVRGATLALVNMELRAATAEFLRRTLIWQERRTLAAGSVTPGQASYALVPSQADAGTVASRVLAAWYGDKPLAVGTVIRTHPGATGDPCMVDLSDPVTITLFPAPPLGVQTKSVVLDIVWTIDPVTLEPDSLTLPYAVLGHLEALVHGTLARMFAMPDKPWSSETHSTFHSAKFRSAVFQARRSNGDARGHESVARPRWQFPRFS